MVTKGIIYLKNCGVFLVIPYSRSIKLSVNNSNSAIKGSTGFVSTIFEGQSSCKDDHFPLVSFYGQIEIQK